ncbi:outer membrane beta-barrel protein [Vibrio mediterranei]|uniref:outer membrane beta-barrel protein n=1 Tax=Vibrio mediterranei TaxID=689 RepID=UPI00148DA248|nr:outer membrane beta-barrel protein [Vibrio mediterranei]NOH30559.1 hypothetical protein [Vibrio mediterranei]
MPNQSSTTGRAIQRLSLIVGSIAVVPVSIAGGNQAYIGGLVGVVDSTFVSGYNIDTKGGASYSLLGGYDFSVHKHIVIGTELEYRSIRDGTISDGDEDVVDYSASGVSINVKPKYYFDDPQYYLAGMIGMGYYSIDVTQRPEDALSDSDNDKQLGLQAAIEFGTELKSGLGFALGISTLNLEVSEVEFGYNMAYIKADYHF